MAEEAKEQSQVISFRVTEEVYGKLKESAQAEGMSVGDLVKGLVEEFAEGVETPPGPAPQPAPLPGEVAELKKWCEELSRREEELRVYTGALGRGLIEVETVVSRMCMILWPGVPLPPWGSFQTAGVDMGELRAKLEELTESGENQKL
jgi:hypothetical protein